MKVYLAGPITGLTYDGATEWRKHAIDALSDHGIEGISPMRGKEYLLGTTTLHDAAVRHLKDAYGENNGFVLSTQRAIVARDRYDVRRVDAVLFNLIGADKVSIGTMVEYGWADAGRLLIVTAMEANGNKHDHAFVRELSGFILPTLDEALDVIIAVGRTR